MDLHSIIVHRLDKESQGNATVTLRQNLISVGEKETEFVTNIKQVYYKKSYPNYGVFDTNTVAYPFQTMLRGYVDQQQEFLPFTSAAMNHLLGVINAIPQATGGYVVFCTLYISKRAVYDDSNAQ